MKSYERLNLPPVKLRAVKRADGVYVWSELRRSYLLLTPEEWVRRHIVSYLVEHLGVPVVSMVEEYPVCVEGMPQRADIVVMGGDNKPLMLVECKAPAVGLDASVLDQAVRYNNIVGARYIMLTNGMAHYCYVTYNGVDYSALDSFPVLY